MQAWQAAVKRGTDVVVASTALVLFSPLLLLIAAAVRLTSPGPVLFRQARIGRHGEIFTLLKFRTMVTGADRRERRGADGANIIVPRDPRITRVGRILRTLSLDELPQLINVLRGEMSLVGPRPDDAKDLYLYGDYERQKLTMKPGVTSLAMVHGRNSIPWRQRLEWEIRYVREFSLLLDFSILARTARVVLLREGVYTADEPIHEEGEDDVRDPC